MIINPPQGINDRWARRRINEAWVSVKDYGAKGDGVTDDTSAIQAAIDAHIGNVFLPPGIYRTTEPIILANTGVTNGVSLSGAGRWYNYGIKSEILVDHSGDGINITSKVQSGLTITDLAIVRSDTYENSGNGIKLDGTSGTLVTSHIEIKRCWIQGHENGIFVRYVIYSVFEQLECSHNIRGIYFHALLDDESTLASNNVGIYKHIRCAANTYGLYFDGNATKNLSFTGLSVEASDTGIYVDSPQSLTNAFFNTVWFELQGTYCCDFRGGFNICFQNVRLADTKPLFRPDTFAGRNISVENVFGGSSSSKLGTPGVNCKNFNLINGDDGLGFDLDIISNFSISQNKHFFNAPFISSGVMQGSSILTPFYQNGKLIKNHIYTWDYSLASWSKGSVTISPQTGPLGESTAYSWSGTVGIQAPDLVYTTDSLVEYAIWAKGSGIITFRAGNDDTFYHKVYHINTTTWSRLSMRFVVTGTQLASAWFSIKLEPDDTDSIHIWRPGVYNDYNSIDTRPKIASDIYEGGEVDFSTYSFARREGTNIVVRGSAAPTAGTWRIGDKCENTSLVAGGYIGWVCTAAGTPGTWKGFGLIAS